MNIHHHVVTTSRICITGVEFLSCVLQDERDSDIETVSGAPLDATDAVVDGVRYYIRNGLPGARFVLFDR